MYPIPPSSSRELSVAVSGPGGEDEVLERSEDSTASPIEEVAAPVAVESPAVGIKRVTVVHPGSCSHAMGAGACPVSGFSLTSSTDVAESEPAVSGCSRLVFRWNIESSGKSVSERN